MPKFEPKFGYFENVFKAFPLKSSYQAPLTLVHQDVGDVCNIGFCQQLQLDRLIQIQADGQEETSHMVWPGCDLDLLLDIRW